jgi:uncharacterized protein YggE
MNSRFALMVLLCFDLVLPATAQEGGREPVMTVLGKGSFEAKPEIARFQATVSSSGKTLEAAVKQHDERATQAMSILQDLKTSGLVIQKSNFRTSERRIPKPVAPGQAAPVLRPETVVDGYTAATDFSLKATSLDNLNRVVTKLADSGLFNIQRVQFNVAQERAALNQARRAAMLDAHEQAQAYAEPVNLELGQIVSITDGEAQPPDGEADLPARRPGPCPCTVQIIPPAAVEFTASVNVTWSIAPRGTKP